MNSEFFKLELPIIIAANQPQWTIEFWILLPWKQPAGDILTILFNDGNKYLYTESAARFLEYTYPSGTTSSVFTSALTTLDFSKSLWKPFRLTYTSASQVVTLDTLVATQGSKISLGSSRLISLTFCESGACFHVIRQVMVWSQVMSYDMKGRTPPLKASAASLMAHWPLDEGRGEYLYDRGPTQVVYPILGRHAGQNFRWKNTNQISPYMSHLFMCLDSSLVYDPLLDRCDPFNVPTMSFNPSNDPVKLS